MSFSDQANDSILERDVDEAWLLWKLGKVREARNLTFSLLSSRPDNPDLIHLRALIHIEEGNFKKALSLIKHLEKITPHDKRVDELKGDLYIRSSQWDKAEGVYRMMLARDPGNWNYKVNYAQILFNLKRFNEAYDLYSELLSDKSRYNSIIWDYRQAKEAVSSFSDSGFKYYHGPESLRKYSITEELGYWLKNDIRVKLSLFEEIHKKRALGDTARISEIVYGEKLVIAYLWNEFIDISGALDILHSDSESFHAFEYAILLEDEGISSKFTGVYNQLVRDPIEGLVKKARLDKISLSSNFPVYEWWNAGFSGEFEWYRVPSKENQINGNKDLGQKYIGEIFSDFILIDEPYLAINFNYRHSHWSKPFNDAEEVIDFLEDERINSAGLSLGKKWANGLETKASLMRSYDHKRNFYSTLSSCSIDLWVKESIKATVSYEFNYEGQGTSGSGNSQSLDFKLKILF